MTVVLKVELPNGKKIKCDTRCYDAIGPVCHCPCGGMNHGVGLKQARENIEKLQHPELDEQTRDQFLEGLSEFPETVQKAIMNETIFKNL